MSRPETIKKSQRALDLSKQMKKLQEIADIITREYGKCSLSLIKEYLSRNTHSLNCPTCHGHGVSRQRSTGISTPICDRE